MNQIPTVSWRDWNWPVLSIAGLIGLALSLRVWGIWFGLPYIFHVDEDLEVVRALQLGSGSFDFQRIYKGGLFYLLFFEYGVLFVVLKVIGVVHSATDFAHYYFRDPSAFYLIGRATTAAIGTINVYLIYRIGRLAYSTRAGLIAAAFLAVNILHAKLSHFTIVDVPMACLATATIYFALKIAKGGSRSDFSWAAVFLALAATTKITAILLIVPLAVSYYFFALDHGGRLRQVVLFKPLWQAIAIFIVVYVLTTPGIVLNFGGFFEFMLRKFGIGVTGSVGDVTGIADKRTMLSSTNLFVFYFDAIKNSMTWPVFTICLAGIGYGLWNRKPADIVLISFVFTFYLLMSMTTDTKEFFPRYILPVIPVVALLGAVLLDDIQGRIIRARKLLFGILSVGLICALPASQIIADNHLMVQKDTRAIANEWFEANIPAGATVFIEGTRTRPSELTIPLQNSAKNIQAMIEQYRKSEPGKAKYFSIAMENMSGPSYNLTLVRGTGLKDLRYYKEQGVQYFVLRPKVYEGSRRQYGWPKIVMQVRSDPDISMVKSFRPDPKAAPGPYIEIYRVRKQSD